MRRLLQSLLCGAVVLGVASASFATTINGNFSRNEFKTFYTGLAVAPDLPANTYWNQCYVQQNTGYVTNTTSDMILSDGVTGTGISFTIANAGTVKGYYNPTSAIYAQPMVDSYAYIPSGTADSTLTFNGLDNAKTYDLYFYQANGVAANSTGVFTIGTDVRTAANSGQNSAFIENDNYVKFSGLSPSGGVITGTANSGASIDGFQLVEIPEPSTLVLLASGLIGLLCYAWRKRK